MRLARNDKLAELDKHQTSQPMMVSVVTTIPTGDNFTFAEAF